MTCSKKCFKISATIVEFKCNVKQKNAIYFVAIVSPFASHKVNYT